MSSVGNSLEILAASAERASKMAAQLPELQYHELVATFGVLLNSVTKSVERQSGGNQRMARGRVLADILSTVEILDKMTDKIEKGK